MARNIVLPGLRRLTVTAPATAAAGDLVIVNRMFGIALTAAASAASVPIDTGATATLRKLNGASTSQLAGSNVHWDATNANATTSATSNLLIGVAAAATANADTSITVHLNPSF
jgi:predicted RecA/RadA family phage recombinase